TAPEQLAAAGQKGLPQRITEELAVGQQQHARADMAAQTPSDDRFTATARLDHEGEFGATAEFHQADPLNLRERAVATASAAATEGSLVGRRVGDVKGRAVDADQAKSAKGRSGHLVVGQR